MAKILLVEDDNNLREIYGERLLAEGYEIVSARDGEEALSVAITEKPDLIISDVMMPKISGFDMLDILRQTPETKDVKIIMMTALSQAEDKARADMLGANKYLVKSQVTLEDVARVVHDILEEPKPEQTTEKPAETTNQTAPEPVVQPIVATPTDDSASGQVQVSNDNTQTNSDDAVATEDNTQITDTDADNTQVIATDEQTDSNAPNPTEPVIDKSKNTVAQQSQSNQIDQASTEEPVQNPVEQTEQPQDALNITEQNDLQEPQTSLEQPLATEPAQEAVNQTVEDAPQQPTDPAEQPPQKSSNLVQANPENQNQPQKNSAIELIQQTPEQDQPQLNIEQPIVIEPTQQTEQEPTTQQEQPQEANMQPQALPVNPIAQDVTETPNQELSEATIEQPVSNSGEAEPAADELTEVTNQIEDFIKNSVTPLSDHQEPLTQPSEENINSNILQEQIQQTTEENELNATSGPTTSNQDNEITQEDIEEKTQSQESLPHKDTNQEDAETTGPESQVIDATAPNQNTEQSETTNEPKEPQDSTIPPVIPVEDTAENNQNDETRNPEPASVRKKVITPMHGDSSLGAPDINKLYQEELAKEAEEMGLQNPSANSIISASTNPISIEQGNSELPQLETIDASQIPGISTDGTAPIGVVTPTKEPEQPAKADIEAQEPHEDPNNPNNIAL